MAWLQVADEYWLNPSSPYRSAAAVHAKLESIREEFAELLNIESARLIFNSGTTEGNNAVISHWSETLGSKSRIAISPIEHPSVLEPAKAAFAGRIEWIPVDEAGVVQFDSFDFSKVEAVSLMAANNETGILQPWQEVAEICDRLGIAMHCDASQLLGKDSFEIPRSLYVTGCGHKFGGPKGGGFLVVPHCGTLSSQLRGGAQEHGLRAGTEDVASVASMFAALKWALSQDFNKLAAGKELFWERLRDLEGTIRVGAEVSSLWNTMMVLMPEFASSRWVRKLEMQGYLVATGSACSTGKDGPSHVLSAMGLSHTLSSRAIRVSSGWETRDEDWLALAEAFHTTYHLLKEDSLSESSQVISI